MIFTLAVYIYQSENYKTTFKQGPIQRGVGEGSEGSPCSPAPPDLMAKRGEMGKNRGKLAK